jgi:hypothetical protein
MPRTYQYVTYASPNSTAIETLVLPDLMQEVNAGAMYSPPTKV